MEAARHGEGKIPEAWIGKRVAVIGPVVWQGELVEVNNSGVVVNHAGVGQRTVRSGFVYAGREEKEGSAIDGLNFCPWEQVRYIHYLGDDQSP